MIPCWESLPIRGQRPFLIILGTEVALRSCRTFRLLVPLPGCCQTRRVDHQSRLHKLALSRKTDAVQSGSLIPHGNAGTFLHLQFSMHLAALQYTLFQFRTNPNICKLNAEAAMHCLSSETASLAAGDRAEHLDACTAPDAFHCLHYTPRHFRFGVTLFLFASEPSSSAVMEKRQGHQGGGGRNRTRPTVEGTRRSR